jgi:hypothetical protein
LCETPIHAPATVLSGLECVKLKFFNEMFKNNMFLINKTCPAVPRDRTKCKGCPQMCFTRAKQDPLRIRAHLPYSAHGLNMGRANCGLASLPPGRQAMQSPATSEKAERAELSVSCARSSATPATDRLAVPCCRPASARAVHGTAGCNSVRLLVVGLFRPLEVQ